MRYLDGIKSEPKTRLEMWRGWKNHLQAVWVSSLSITRKIPVTECEAEPRPTTNHEWAHQDSYKPAQVRDDDLIETLDDWLLDDTQAQMEEDRYREAQQDV